MHEEKSIIFPVLIADIGGTNARFAYLTDSASELLLFDSLKTADFDNIDQAIKRNILPHLKNSPKTLIIAWAGPIDGVAPKLTNSTWFIDKQALAKSLDLKAICLLNDFEAQALATTVLPAAQLQQIGGKIHESNASRAILGPGTGLGVAGLISFKGQYLPIAGEGGHIDFPLKGEDEFALFKYLPLLEGRLTAEEVLSGRGLLAIYHAFCKKNGVVIDFTSADKVSHAALHDNNHLARQAIDLFLKWLARIAGDIALIFKAKGGVYIGGGIVPRLLPLLDEVIFRDEFENKAPHQWLMQDMPIFIIKDSNSALTGMAGLAKNPKDYLVNIDYFS
ncbi:glucokinase [Bartonella sp. HY406]|uniref:glucokinase n=1 Tax=Bartonella sp. HY406 TaxID=2979331 RepID=UPI0021C61468|nr:glucokinase [Bartonella sp. HY406]UXN04013.1 glucokinase [Bartonella sp. HY406]